MTEKISHNKTVVVKGLNGAPDQLLDIAVELEAKAAPDVPLELCPTCGEDRPFSGTCGTSDSDTKALCKRKCKPSQPVTLTDEEIDKIADEYEDPCGRIRVDQVFPFSRAIIAALREKQGGA